MVLLKGTKIFATTANLISKSRFSFAHKLADTVKKDDEVLPLDFFRENCILVDANDKPIGSASKRDCHKVEGDEIRLHRAFSVFLFNEDGDMLLQKRSNHKVTVMKFHHRAIDSSGFSAFFECDTRRKEISSHSRLINISLYHQTNKKPIKLA